MIYNIIKCKKEDIFLLKNFIHNHWKENHSLVKSDKLLNFQHWDERFLHYNFFIAINNVTNAIDGIMGYIPTSHYDYLLKPSGDYWGAIWKVREDVVNEEIGILGLLLWEKLSDFENFKSYAAIGISQVAKRFYKMARLKVSCLNQYYILRQQNDPYEIAIAPINFGISQTSDPQNIKKINIDENIYFKPFYKPLKSIEYLINRYKKHPIYKYSFFNILDKVVLVTRTITINNSKVIRIVDCLGNLQTLPNLYSDFQAILYQKDAEYVDFVNYGIDESVFINMGFKKLDLDGDVIIPNYFEPFEQRNVKIEFSYKSNYEDYTIFKGDSDQDRPNII